MDFPGSPKTLTPGKKYFMDVSTVASGDVASLRESPTWESRIFGWVHTYTDKAQVPTAKHPAIVGVDRNHLTDHVEFSFVAPTGGNQFFVDEQVSQNGGGPRSTQYWYVKEPRPPVLSGPTGTIRTTTPRFHWTAVAGATGYNLEFLNKTTGATSDYWTTETHSPSGLQLDPGVYEVQVLAKLAEKLLASNKLNFKEDVPAHGITFRVHSDGSLVIEGTAKNDVIMLGHTEPGAPDSQYVVMDSRFRVIHVIDDPFEKNGKAIRIKEVHINGKGGNDVIRADGEHYYRGTKITVPVYINGGAGNDKAYGGIINFFLGGDGDDTFVADTTKGSKSTVDGGTGKDRATVKKGDKVKRIEKVTVRA
jgi:hypothetical protein